MLDLTLDSAMKNVFYLLPAIILMLLAPSLVLTGCSLYPLGDSHTAQYFGGHGNGIRPNGYVPREVQRNNAMTTHP